MKKLICLVLILTLSLLAVSALAEDATVTAIGSATLSLTPDYATFTVGVTTQDTLISTAQSANAAAMQAILDALLALGVEQKDLQTDQYSVNPVYSYQSDSPTLTGYEIRNTVMVTVRNLDQLPTLLDSAVAAGANNVYSLGFQSSEQSTAYEQALKAAAQNAQRKAAMMAQAIGREAGATLSLEEIRSSISAYNSAIEFSMDSGGATPIESGQITVSAQVQAIVEMN